MRDDNRVEEEDDGMNADLPVETEDIQEEGLDLGQESDQRHEQELEHNSDEELDQEQDSGQEQEREQDQGEAETTTGMDEVLISPQHNLKSDMEMDNSQEDESEQDTHESCAQAFAKGLVQAETKLVHVETVQ